MTNKYTAGITDRFEEKQPEEKTVKVKGKPQRTHINLALPADLLDDIGWIRASLGLPTITATINYILQDHVNRHEDKINTFKSANRIK